MLTEDAKRFRYERDDRLERDGMRVAGGETGPRQLAALLRIEDRLVAIEARLGAVEAAPLLEAVEMHPDLAEVVRLLKVIAGEPDGAEPSPPKRGPGRPRKDG